MPINPDFDLKKVPLQAAVAYLISLHDNEVDWNLLGIRVIGAIDALPIPPGNYEYGDAYMVGTSTPYDMYIYTRPDGAVHTEGYWFPIGKFPVPGPQGPKGDGFEQVYKWTNGTVGNVTYDTTDGAKVLQTTTIDYTDSTDGSTKQQQFNSTTTLPIVPGKYVSMDATSDNKKLEVKVDDTALALDYYKIDKGDYPGAIVPIYYKGKQDYKLIGYQSGVGTLVMRGGNSEIKCDAIDANYWRNLDGNRVLSFTNVKEQLTGGCLIVVKTPNDKGNLSTGQLTMLKELPQYQIQYNNQIYYRMDPLSAPDGTLNYVHIDSVQNGSGGYKATGQCFSVTVSTASWQIVNLDFTRSYTHQICVSNPTTNAKYYFTLVNNKSASYHGNAAGLINALSDTDTEFQPATRSHTTNGVSAALLYRNDSGYLVANYGTNAEQMTSTQIVVWDTVT